MKLFLYAVGAIFLFIFLFRIVPNWKYNRDHAGQLSSDMSSLLAQNSVTWGEVHAHMVGTSGVGVCDYSFPATEYTRFTGALHMAPVTSPQDVKCQTDVCDEWKGGTQMQVYRTAPGAVIPVQNGNAFTSLWTFRRPTDGMTTIQVQYQKP